MNRLFVLAALLLMAFPLRAAELNSSSTLIDTQPPQSMPLPVAETRFVPGIDDLPLMPGLDPVPDQDTVFVVPRSGRIAQSAVQGSVDIDSIYSFYRRSLPQLGWKMATPKKYQRDGEQLRIEAHADGKVTTVRFSVTPD